ncbi:deoxyhypusine hydroxylase [Mitosporidium daphniae]
MECFQIPVEANDSTYVCLENDLLNANKRVSLQDRFRALFTLKHLANDRSVAIISKAFADNSALLKHELAYVLGQMRLTSAVPTLIEVLQNKTENPMVRHEAAEAMGAIGDISCLPILHSFANAEDENVSVKETCCLAIDRLQRIGDHSHPDHGPLISPPVLPFASIDPAVPSIASPTMDDIPKLEATLNDESASLYDRYAAMFALRNAGVIGATASSEEISLAAVEVLCNSLVSDKSSALFRHEIAYVLGQRQHPASVSALSTILGRIDELPMVRHECAEALGAVATDEALEALRPFINDPEDVVRESCLIALDILEYEQSNTLHYADGLLKAAQKTPKELKEASSIF